MRQEPHAGAPVVHGSEPAELTREAPNSQRKKAGHRWCRDKITRNRSTFVRPSVRRAILKAEPDCRTCGAPATEIDHIKPICLGGRHDATNWAPICRRCHLRKTSQEAHRVRWHCRQHGPAEHVGAQRA
jgi:5-methylcytosine-specific restriction endonuclease McrA